MAKTTSPPPPAAWVVGEWRDSREREYCATNHPDRTPLRALAAAIKARWSWERAHQQIKKEPGLDHVEGRTGLGLHHHALMTQISFAFLQHPRLREVRRRGENVAHAAAHADRRRRIARVIGSTAAKFAGSRRSGRSR
jgi:SRSO17 transposase